MKLRIIILRAGCIALLFLLFSCKPEIDLNDDYQDVTIAYGLLNPSDDVHYIKVYKGFLTKGNAIQHASHLENITYCDSIDVQLRMNNGVLLTLDTTTAIPKDSGIFANPEQVLYYTRATLNPSGTYELIIKNKYSGRTITATTPLVGNSTLTNPMGSYISLINRSSVRFQAPENAVAYEFYMNFYYIEVDKATGEEKRGVVSRKLNPGFLRDLSREVRFDYDASGIYRVIANTLKPDPTVVRYKDGTQCIELVVWAAEKEFMIYLDTQTGGSSIINDKNLYTNMKSEDGNAYGIFSSRNVLKKKFNIMGNSEDSLVRGSLTRDLGFDYYINKP